MQLTSNQRSTIINPLRWQKLMGWFFLFDMFKFLISQKWQFFAGK